MFLLIPFFSAAIIIFIMYNNSGLAHAYLKALKLVGIVHKHPSAQFL